MDTGMAIILAACAPVINQWITTYLHHRQEQRDLARSQGIAITAAENQVLTMDKLDLTNAKIDGIHKQMNAMKDEAVKAAGEAGNLQGQLDERSRADAKKKE
jgi:hypothetical protein